MNDRAVKYITAATGLALLTVAGLKMLHDLPAWKDMILWDEAFYMLKGLDIFNKIPKEWGPAYGLWYKLLSYIREDLVQLYYSNFRILVISGGLALFGALLLRRVHPLAAFLLAGLYLISPINTGTWPYISHFCVLIIWLAVGLSAISRSMPVQWMAFAAAALLLSYARPEFYLSFLLLLLPLGISLMRHRTALGRLETYVGAAFIAFVVAGHYLMGFGLFEQGPLFKGSQYTRQVFAFGQHYAINAGEWNGIRHAWLAWEGIFAEKFEVSTSLFATISSNFPEFWKHVAANISHYVQWTFGYLSGVLFAGSVTGGSLIAVRLGWLAVVVFLVVRFVRPGRVLPFVEPANRIALFSLAVLALPAAISCVLIYPRDHYLLLQMPLLLFAIALFFPAGEGGKQVSRLAAVAGAGILLAAMAPSGGKVTYFDHWDGRTDTRNYQAIQYLRGLEIEQPTQLLENEGGLTVYAGQPQLRSVFPVDLRYEGSLADYVAAQPVGIIFVSTLLLEDPNLEGDRPWQDFLADPSVLSFRRQELPGTDAYLLIRENTDDGQ